MKTADIEYFSTNIQRQFTLDEAGQVLAESAQALGWELAAFHSDLSAPSLERARDGNYIAQTMGWPDDYLQQWIKLDLGRDCPLGQKCIESKEPFFWTSNTRDAMWRGLSPDQCNVLDYYGALVSGGIAIPVQRTDGKTGYVSWCARTSQHLRKRYESSFCYAYLLSHVFIYHAERLNQSQNLISDDDELSDREVECLTWAARGRTEMEISQLLHRSVATIHFHLRNAITKLNARNRTHAVAIACTRGLICTE